MFANAVDDKAIRQDVHKSINEIQKLLNRELHGGRTDVNKHALKALPEEQTTEGTCKCDPKKALYKETN